MTEVLAELERRYCPDECRVDLLQDRKIRGYAIMFGKRSENLGGFFEIIKPEAVDRTFKEGLDVRALVDHESSKVLGRNKAGTLVLEKTRKGLKAEIDPPNTSFARDILESIDRGDITGMSFAFRVLDDNWTEVDGFPIREILDMRISEVSIVTFPAYPDTSVQVAKRALDRFLAHQHNTKWRSQWNEMESIRLGLD